MAESVTVTGHPFPPGISVGVYSSYGGLDYGSQTRRTAPKNPLVDTVTVPSDLEIDLELDAGTYFLAADFNGKLSGLSFEAKVADQITISLSDPGAPDEGLALNVSGKTIEVSLATGNDEAITSTLADVVAAINGDADAFALVTASLTGAGATVAAAESTVLNRDAITGWQFAAFTVVAS